MDSSLSTAVHRDPVGAGLAITIPTLVVLVAAWYWMDVIPVWPVATVTTRAEQRGMLAEPMATWRRKANPSDVLDVPGIDVEYWGNPRASYGLRATRERKPFTGLVFHYTGPAPIERLVQYQHNGDVSRGGSYGYHIYVDPAGRVLQGAPLSKRTNHLKPSGHENRRHDGDDTDSSNSIGVSLTSACVLKPGGAITEQCSHEHVTAPQQEAAAAVARVILKRWSIPCDRIWGHGDLQVDRAEFEGSTMRTMMRTECASGH